MKHTKEEKAQAWEVLTQYKGQELLAIVNSVSRSGMSRRIEFYGISQTDGYYNNIQDYVEEKKPAISRIGYSIAKVIDYPYDVNKGGLLVKGCGMDMIFHVLYSVNMTWIHKQETENGTKKPFNHHEACKAFFQTTYKR